jgi:hypothetical protein
MRLVSFKPLRKGALVGLATMELPSGLKIAECPALVSAGKAWPSFPGKLQLDRDGKQVVLKGEKQFTKFLDWPDRDTRDLWSAAVVELVREKHLEALR